MTQIISFEKDELGLLSLLVALTKEVSLVV